MNESCLRPALSDFDLTHLNRIDHIMIFCFDSIIKDDVAW